MNSNLKITRLHYAGDKYSNVSIDSLEKLFHLLTPDNAQDLPEMPTHISLEDGTILEFNYYAFNACFAKGRISEEDLMALLMESANNEIDQVKQG